MRFRHAALAVLVASALTRPAAAQLAPSRLAATQTAGEAASERLSFTLDSIASRAMSNQSIPGLSVAIVRDGQVVAERGYGTVDPRHPHQATAWTLYQIASISKQFTAAAVLRLAEQGQIGLDEPITKYVDGLAPLYKKVTVRRLLNHTAGVPNFTEFFRDFHSPISPAQLVDSLNARPLLFAPGTGFHYSNSGYYLLGLAIEHVTGLAYAEYLDQQFWTPLGMDDTQYCGSRPHTPLPAGYVRDHRGDAVRAEPWDPSVLYSAGSVCSTAADLAKWEVALGEGKVLSPASYREMTSPQPPLDPSVRMSYGFAMMVDTTESGPYLHHDGAVSGFRAQVAWYPDEHLAVVVLMNQGLAAPEPIERDLARAVLGVDRSAPHYAARPAADPLPSASTGGTASPFAAPAP